MIKVNDKVRVMVNGYRLQGEVVEITKELGVATIVIPTYYSKDIVVVKERIENLERVTSDFQELMKQRGIRI